MRFCLVSAATTNDLFHKETLIEENYLRLPLGILSLASIVKQKGVIPSVVDLDRIHLSMVKDEGSFTTGIFAAYVADKLASMDTNFFGFSSICSSYPLTLRIISELKQQRPDAYIILGGPQASASADSTLKAFRSVDVIVRGEGDTILPNLLEELDGSRCLDSVLGISYCRDGKTIHNPDAPVLEDLDSLPLPAYYLVPNITEYDFLPLEAGRGCPFSCTFCSTSQFFRQRHRLKSPKVIVKQMKKLHHIYRINNFELVHDNLTVNRKQIVDFCGELIRSSQNFAWSCSARTDCLDDKLIELMQKAGCRGIFVGIESGSERMQKLIQKGLKIGIARERISSLDGNKIEVAASFIIGFPEETLDDLRKTANLYVDLLRHDYVDPQLGLLSPLTGTTIHRRHKNELIYDTIISDMAFQGLEQDPEDKEIIAAYPEVFSSFYSVPTNWLDRQYLSELEEFLLAFRGDLRWLLVALLQVIGDTLKVFNLWRTWQAIHTKRINRKLRAYYSGLDFRKDLLIFVQSEIAKRKPEVAHVLLALAENVNLEPNYEKPNLDLQFAEGNIGAIAPNALPTIAPGVVVNHLKADYSKIIDCLRKCGDLSKVPKTQSTVVTKYKSRIEIVQLSAHSRELLLLCNGTQEVQEITQIFASFVRNESDIPEEKACLFGLELLRQQELIVIQPPKPY